MNKDKRKALRLRVQAHGSAGDLRKRMNEAAFALPALDTKFDEKIAGLTRLIYSSKMPKRVVQLHKGYYAIRPCVSGVVFTAAVFAALGARENHKVVAPMARLSDALAYYFRNSRMRTGLEYNLSVEQAQADEKALRPLFGELSKMLTECGVAVMGNPISSIEWANADRPAPSAAPNDLEIQVITLARQVKELQGTLTLAQDLYERLERVEKICNSLVARMDSTVQFGLDLDIKLKEQEQRLKVVEMQKLYAPNPADASLPPEEQPILSPNPLGVNL